MSPPAFQMIPEPRDWSDPLKICTVERLRRSAISPNPRISFAPRPFRNGDRDLAGLASPQHIQQHALSHRASFERQLDVVGVLNRLASQLNDDVAYQNARLCGGSLRFQRED